MTVIITDTTPVATVITGFLADLEAHQAMATGVQFDVCPIVTTTASELFVLRNIESGAEIDEEGGPYGPDHMVPVEESARVTFDCWLKRSAAEATDALLRAVQVVAAVQEVLGKNPTRGDLVNEFAMQTWTATPMRSDTGVIFHLEFVLSVFTSLRS